MNWIKTGLVIDPQPNLYWTFTHAMVPFAEKIEGDDYRIYFSGRDEQNRSLIGYAELNINAPSKVKRYSKEPVLGLGELGCFDDNGVTPSWIINHDDKKYLYYIGWNKGSTVRMHLVAGLATSTDGGKSFQRVLKVPILDRTNEEPYTLNTAPCVMLEDGLWKMWYVSGVIWKDKDTPRYNIKYAESSDGINWIRNGVVCIDFKSDDENALARPCVIKEDGIYKMWFSYKEKSYRIGYAESEDGMSWERKDDEAGIDVSESGWDSEMIEYAFVFNHKDKKYMLYNGNDYGKNGIGLAIME